MLVKHNFKIGDIVKTVDKPYEKDFKAGIGYTRNTVLTIIQIDEYNDYIVAFFKESCGGGIRWSETHPNFYLLNKQNIYECW